MEADLVCPFDVDTETHPIDAVARWYALAVDTLGADIAHRVALATVDDVGVPAVRIVLCRSIDREGGWRFFTNYNSPKGRDLDTQRVASAVFHWPRWGRQLRATGTVERLSAADSDAYWATRPRESQLSALASDQSHIIDGLDAVFRRRDELGVTYESRVVPRPDHWGGYRLVPTLIEFWQDGHARFHQRVAFRREKTGAWRGAWLAP